LQKFRAAPSASATLLLLSLSKIDFHHLWIRLVLKLRDGLLLQCINSVSKREKSPAGNIKRRFMAAGIIPARIYAPSIFPFKYYTHLYIYVAEKVSPSAELGFASQIPHFLPFPFEQILTWETKLLRAFNTNSSPLGMTAAFFFFKSCHIFHI